jgi:HD superfamily phosphohydrolase YqeK
MIPTFNGQRGHPPWIPAARIKAIVEASAAKSTLRDFLSNDILEIPCVDSCTLMDMDTPAAYEALCHLAPLRDYPTPDECRAIWTLLRVPEPVRRHSMAVTNVALTIGGLINQKSNQTLNLDKLSAAAMLHDIMKGCSDHAKAGAEMMMKFGFSGISEAIACHMKLTVDGIPNVVGISEILYLSDKLCTEDVCISLELRLKSALDRYPSSAADFIKERFQTAMRLQKAVERITHSVSLDAYLSRACQ